MSNITAWLQHLEDVWSLGKLTVCARARECVCGPKVNDCLHLRRLRLESALFFWLIWPSLPRAVWPSSI